MIAAQSLTTYALHRSGARVARPVRWALRHRCPRGGGAGW